MKEGKLRTMALSTGAYTSLAAFPMIASADNAISHDRYSSLPKPIRNNELCNNLFTDIRVGRKRRRGRRRKGEHENAYTNTNLPVEIWNAVNHCRGGDTMDMLSSTNHHATNHFNHLDDFNEEDLSENNGKKAVIINAYDNTKTMTMDHVVINASRKRKKKGPIRWKKKESIPESTIALHDEPQPLSQTHESFSPRPRLVIEFDTQAVGGIDHGNSSIRKRIRSRIGTDNNDEWNRRLPNRGPALSISLDAFSSSSMISQNANNEHGTTQHASTTFNNNNDSQTLLLQNLLLPTTRTTFLLLSQTFKLLPPLLLSRRALNSTYTAIVDYFRGRTFRTTYTKLERAYLRYYEFPAVTRAMARLVSQIGILWGLSWAVRWWMILVLVGNNNSVAMMMGVTGMEDVGTMSIGGRDGDGAIGPGWKVGLPCHRRGKGMAWLCGFIWIGAVVGIGHVLAMALSVWGGPLRLKATAQQHTENPKHVLRRIIHHPIIWIRELEEWKHMPSFSRGNDNRRSGRGGELRSVIFNPDPLLFPATWLPLRWLQIFAVAKAFSTDPLQYRWCSPEKDKIVIPRLMKQYLVQLALGDEWHRVFLGEKRVGLGILVLLSYFIALLWMVFTTFTLDGGAAAMLIPSVFAAIISGIMNIMIFWNRLDSKEQRKALHTMGLA